MDKDDLIFNWDNCVTSQEADILHLIVGMLAIGIYLVISYYIGPTWENRRQNRR